MFARRKYAKTDYRQRLKLLKSRRPRLVVRVGIKNANCQIVTYGNAGDKTIIEVTSGHLKKYGWLGHAGNIPSCYLAGLLIGFKARQKGINEAILDIGLKDSVKNSSVYAVTAGANQAGLKVPAGDVLPSKDRIEGKHIADYAAKLKKEDKQKYERIFSKYIKNNLSPEEMPNHFNETKNKIMEEFKDMKKNEASVEADEEEWEDVK